MEQDLQSEGPARCGGAVDWPSVLERVDGSHDLLRTVVDAFLEESPPLLDGLRKAISSGDPTAVRNASHMLKGSLRFFGASRAFESALCLEKMGQNATLETAEATWTVLNKEVAELALALKDYPRPDGDGARSPA